MLNQQETTMAEDEVAEDNRVGVMQQTVVVATAERKELVDEVARIIHEDEVDVHGTMKKQVKTLIKSELAVLEVSELEVQDHVEAEVDLEVVQEVAIEALHMSQEVEEEDEAEVDVETMRNHKKLSTNQTQRTATVMSAVSKKL